MRDPLSETGVLRLLNECPPPERSSEHLVGRTAAREEQPVAAAADSGPSTAEAATCCPRCANRLAAEMEICPRCRTRLATSSKAWQAVYRAAARALAAR